MLFAKAALVVWLLWWSAEVTKNYINIDAFAKNSPELKQFVQQNNTASYGYIGLFVIAYLLSIGSPEKIRQWAKYYITLWNTDWVVEILERDGDLVTLQYTNTDNKLRRNEQIDLSILWEFLPK